MYSFGAGRALVGMYPDDGGVDGPVERAFVRTDIVSSTELVCRLGDRLYADLTLAHDRLLIDEAERRNGSFVRRTGDGMLVEFDVPEAAVQWALTVYRRVPELLGFRIRVGGHRGPVLVADHGYVGRTLHVVARLTDAARPAGIVISGDLADAADSMPMGRRSSLALRGVAEPVDAVVVATGDLACRTEPGRETAVVLAC